jgi:acetoin utilization protein AcuC
MLKAIVYHEDYSKYDLGTSHPLLGDKPRKTMEFFREKSIMSEVNLFTPTKACEEDILRVHEATYVNYVKTLSESGGWLASDTPAPPGIFEYASLATGGTLLAGRKLFEGFDCTVNPLAGFHHASRDTSSGFCFFNDIAIVIEYLREIHNLKRFLIIDLDVHHCNGTQEIYYEDPTVLTISFHQDGRTLYPGTGSLNEIGREEGKGFTVNLPLPPGTANKEYIHAFEEIVPPITKQFTPQIIIYQSGVDTHFSDPLGGLCLTFQVYFYLAKRIKELSEETCNRLLVLFG